MHSRCFCWFPAAILVHQNGTPIWRLHTNLYKGAWNVSVNNSETVGHKELRLGQIVHILGFYNISFCWFLSMDGFQFIFLLLNDENVYLPASDGALIYPSPPPPPLPTSPHISAPFNGYLKLSLLFKLNRRGKSRQNKDLRSHTGSRTRNLSSSLHRIKRPHAYQHFANPCFMDSFFCNTAYWKPLICINVVWFLTDRFYWSDEQMHYFILLHWNGRKHRTGFQTHCLSTFLLIMNYLNG